MGPIVLIINCARYEIFISKRTVRIVQQSIQSDCNTKCYRSFILLIAKTESQHGHVRMSFRVCALSKLQNQKRTKKLKDFVATKSMVLVTTVCKINFH